MDDQSIIHYALPVHLLIFVLQIRSCVTVTPKSNSSNSTGSVSLLAHTDGYCSVDHCVIPCSCYRWYWTAEAKYLSSNLGTSSRLERRLRRLLKPTARALRSPANSETKHRVGHQVSRLFKEGTTGVQGLCLAGQQT